MKAAFPLDYSGGLTSHMAEFSLPKSNVGALAPDGIKRVWISSDPRENSAKSRTESMKRNTGEGCPTGHITMRVNSVSIFAARENQQYRRDTIRSTHEFGTSH
jgi:hypothetical protein